MTVTSKTRTYIGSCALWALVFLTASIVEPFDAYRATWPWMLAAGLAGHIMGRCSSPWKPETEV